MRSPNLSAIATEAGVSRMTVSRALRNLRGVSPETRNQILAAAERLGYRPNPLVSAFMSYVRTSRVNCDAGVLAYITNTSTRHGWRSLDVYVRLFAAARDQAESRGYQMEEFWLHERGMTSRRMSEILYARGIRGIVIGPMPSAHAHLNLDWNKFTSSAIGYSLLKPMLSRASNDQYGSMLLALRELRRLGYTKVALAMPHDNDARVSYRWSAAYLSHHWRHHPKDTPLLYLPAKWEDAAAIAWLRRKRPQAVVTTQSHFYNRLVKEGFDIPNKLGVVNVDWSEVHKPVSGVNQQTEQVGRAAVDLVVNQINKNESGIPVHPKTILISGTWVPGSTTHALRNAVMT